MPSRLPAALFGACLSAVVAIAMPSPVAAQEWPARQIQLIVPFPAGGSTDLVARAIAEPLRQRLGQPVIVENRAGGGGLVGTEQAARAAADGYTLLFGGSTNVLLSALGASKSVDLVNDFAPVAIIGDIPNVLVASAGCSIKSIADVITQAKANPGKLNYGHAGVGTASHLAGELFAKRAGIQIVPVPYRGNQPAVTDLLGGHIPLMFSNLAGTLPYMEGDKLRIVAITGSARSPLAPNIPTFAEGGVSGLENGVWMALMAPKGTPDAVIAKLVTHVDAVIKEPATIERLRKLGTEPAFTPPKEFAARMKAEHALWSQIVKDANIKLE
jgi:tripartite-type tricarboxylate transporter receptor subunit TctC